MKKFVMMILAAAVFSLSVPEAAFARSKGSYVGGHGSSHKGGHYDRHYEKSGKYRGKSHKKKW